MHAASSAFLRSRVSRVGSWRYRSDQAVRYVCPPWAVNHGRFLILPWSQIRNFAIHNLARAAQHLPCDCPAHYGGRTGIAGNPGGCGAQPGRVCYRAANWIEARGHRDRTGRAHGVANQIFLYPLHRRWRSTPAREGLSRLPGD